MKFHLIKFRIKPFSQYGLSKHSGKIINGLKISNSISRQLKDFIQSQKNVFDSSFIPPSLQIIQVGNDPSSTIYVQNKIKMCESIGIKGILKKMDKGSSDREIIQEIEKANLNNEISSIIVQLPLPIHVDTFTILSKVNPLKDVDALNPLNQGAFYHGALSDISKCMIPPTALGVMEILNLILNYKNETDKYLSSLDVLSNNYSKLIDLQGVDSCVIGRGLTSGLPSGLLLQKYDSTVTHCHSKTKNLKEKTSSADLLVTAVGKPHFIKKDFIKENAIVIDIGISSVIKENKRIVVGDVDVNDVIDKISYLTPVPGGVGKLTVVMLMRNIVFSWKNFFLKR